MGLLSEIRKLTYKEKWFYVAAFFGTIAPGFLIIFFFRPELVEKYDAFKLVVISLALTLPLMEINAVISACLFQTIPDDTGNNETEKNVDAVRGALNLNFLVIYFPLLLCYLLSLRFKWFLGLVAALEVIAFVVGVLVMLTKKAPKVDLPTDNGH